MTTMFLETDIEFFEGNRAIAYLDTDGNVTWGIGHMDNKVKVGTRFSQAQIEKQFQLDIGVAKAGLDHHVPWWTHLNPARQDVLVNMAFNMGVGKLETFTHFLKDVEESNFASAAQAMLSSAWAEEVPHRARPLAEQMKLGTRVNPETFK